MTAVGLTLNDCYLTNITHCRPPDNRTPTDQETKNCSYILMGEIQLIRPKVIFALGGVAAKYLLGKSVLHITTETGNIYDIQWIKQMTGKDTVVVPVVHPAWVLRQAGEPTEASAKRTLGESIRKGLRHIKYPCLKEAASAS